MGERGSDLEDGLGMEVVGRIGHGDGRIDGSTDALENGRVALDEDVLGKVSHFLG
jgi:hypothetical protein